MDSYSEHLIAGIAAARNTTTADATIKIGVKRKRAYFVPEDIPWTASRCNRLLRTITSRISILQKLEASNRLHTNDKTACHDVQTIARDVENGANNGTFKEQMVGPSPSRDPEWLPGPFKVAAVKTYSGAARRRRDKAKIRATLPKTTRDELTFSTPFVKRILQPDGQPSPSYTANPSQPGHEGRMVHERKGGSRQLPVKPTSTAEEAINNLVQALGSFLQATSPETPTPRTGAASLRSVCLRKVPAYIHEVEEGGNEEESGEDRVRDTTAELYEELESLGTLKRGGWSGLRELVRAHGIWYIHDAISRGLLSGRVIDVLLDVCNKQGAIAEAQQLLAALVHRSTAGSALHCCSRLLNLGETHGSATFVLRTLTALLQQRSITALELGQERRLWHLVLQSVSQASNRAEVAEFLSAYLDASTDGTVSIQGCKVPGIIRSVAVILTAACIRQQSVSDGPGSRFCETISRPVSNAILRAVEPFASSANAPFMLSSLILQIIGLFPVRSNIKLASIQQTSERLPVMIETKVWDPKRRSAATDCFISDVALCIGRSDPDAGDEFLFDAARKLLRASKTVSSSVSPILRALALNGAMAYAEARATKNTWMFAEEIEDLVLDDAHLSTAPETPVSSRPRRRDFEWEDGLCEWIAVIPCDGDAGKVSADDVEDSGIDLSFHSDVGDDESKISNLEKAVAKSPESPVQATPEPFERVYQCARSNTKTEKDNFLPSKCLKNGRHSSVTRTRDDPVLDEEVSDDDYDELALSVRKPGPENNLDFGGIVRSFAPSSKTLVRKCCRRPLKRPSARSDGVWARAIDSEDELGL